MKLQSGTRVVHKIHSEWGVGTIEGSWGSWYSCRGCLEELSYPFPETCPVCGRVTEDDAPPYRINGQDIFDVRFPLLPLLCDPLWPSEKVSINECRLRKVK